MTEILEGFADLAPDYDLAIIDLWGVVHDGTKPYPGVLDCLARMKEAGITRLFLSNAPRRAEAVMTQIEGIGVPRTAYDEVVSSGEIAYRALSEGLPEAAPGAAYYYIGPTKDERILDGLDYRAVDSLGAADFLLVTGLRNDERETVADYEEELKVARGRGLPFLCINPDLRAMRGDRIMPCAGAIAARYEEMGGHVVHFGKPHRAAYDACLGTRSFALSRVVAIGDTPRTDLAGAMNLGIDAVFVTGGLHRADVGHPIDPRRLERFLEESGTAPKAALEALRWTAG